MNLSELASFYLPWSAAVAVTAHEPAIAPLVWQAAGLELPVVQLALAISGVLLARPLAPRREGERSAWRFAIVTVVMLIAACAWTIESRPGLLFTFVVSIGLGFSGYAAVEAIGEEVVGWLRRIIQSRSGQ